MFQSQWKISSQELVGYLVQSQRKPCNARSVRELEGRRGGWEGEGGREREGGEGRERSRGREGGREGGREKGGRERERGEWGGRDGGVQVVMITMCLGGVVFDADMPG